MDKTELLNKLLKMFVAKFGYDKEVKIEPISLEDEQIGSYGGFSVPSIKGIRISKGEDICKDFNLYIDYWSWGWTDENAYWNEKRCIIIDLYGANALANALGVKIKSEITITYEIV